MTSAIKDMDLVDLIIAAITMIVYIAAKLRGAQIAPTARGTVPPADDTTQGRGAAQPPPRRDGL